MITLSRREGESVLVGSDVEIVLDSLTDESALLRVVDYGERAARLFRVSVGQQAELRPGLRMRLLASDGAKARLAFDHAPNVRVRRSELPQ